MVYVNGPYPQWHQKAKMAAIVLGFLYKNVLNGSNSLSFRSIYISCETYKYSIILHGIWNNKTSWKFLKVSKTHNTIG